MAVYEVELASVLAGIALVDPVWDRKVSGLCTDSREIKKGDLFIALIGETHDATQYISDVIAKGAAAVIAQGEQQNPDEINGVPVFYHPQLIQHISKMATRFYGHPSRHMHVVGVTGTNGKSSTCFYIAQMVRAIGAECGVVGTLGYGVYPNLEPAVHTTPQAINAVTTLADFRDQGLQHVAMEVSSHALALGRVKHIEFKTAIFTNLTRDHLDFHKTMDAYGEAKISLFTKFGLETAIVNQDDALAPKVLAAIPNFVKVLQYSVENKADVYAKDIKLTKNGLEAKIVSPWGEATVEPRLYGRFNIANILAALTAVCAQGGDFKKVIGAVNKLVGVPGRMQLIAKPNQPQVLIDYAHTPDALQQALTAIRGHTDGKIWCIFGCGGDRDQGKRAEMGQVVEVYADKVIITNDNPRSEDPEKITADILQGFKSPSEVQIIHSRSEAIAESIKSAAANDIILVAGKGHENYQIIGDQQLPFLDSDVVEQYL